MTSDPLAFIEEEFEWSRSLAKKDIGKEVLSTISYSEAKKMLKDLLLPRIRRQKQLDKAYRKISRNAESNYAPETCIHQIFVDLVWLRTFANDDALNAERLSELLYYWRYNEMRKPTSDDCQDKTSLIDFQLLIDQARAHPIEKLYNGELRNSSGNRLSGLCPFHEEKSPSFFIFTDTNHYHCFGCQAHGDVINYSQKINGETFKEVIEKLTGTR